VKTPASPPPSDAPPPEHAFWRLGVVSYLNSRPLVHGLDADPALELRFDVPSRLAALLDDGSVDAALVPVVDLAAPHRKWKVISDACIGCDGETLTVRVFSCLPPERVETIFVDGDSHTSVVLAQLIWRELYGRPVAVTPLADAPRDAAAVLLIGDKVVTDKPIDFEIETDLGAAWKSLTGLPFVFAAWAADASADTTRLGRRLGQARDAGVRCASVIAEDVGPGMGWPVATARRYLTSRLSFTMTPRHVQGMRRFLELAVRHRLLPDRAAFPGPVEELTFA